MATITIDYTLENNVESVAINSELDSQTELLQQLASSNETLNEIHDAIKENTRMLKKIYNP